MRRRPPVTLIAAQSIDGRITRGEEPGVGFCSPEDQEHFFASLRKFDCQIMGRLSYEMSRKRIRKFDAAGRLRKVLTRNPEKWVGEERPGRVEFTRAEPAALLVELAERGTRACALLGGSQIYSAFLEADLVDEAWITVEPQLFGSGKPLVGRPVDLAWGLEGLRRLNAHALLLRYRRRR